MSSNTGFQKHNIDKALKKEGVDDFDTEAHIDPTLSLKENLDNLEDELGLSLRNDNPSSGKEAERRRASSDLKQARQRHEARSEQSQLVDESMKAEEVFDAPLTDEEFNEWSEDPDEHDILGVDFKEGLL